jgi:hypothetical protein
MTKPILATPKMDRAESKRIYGELRMTQASPEKEIRLKRADDVFARAQKRGERVTGDGRKDSR